MSIKYLLYDYLLDIVKMGPRFFVQGIQSRKKSGALKRIDVAGTGGIYVRSGDSDFDTVRQVFRNQDYRIVNEIVDERVRARYDEIVRTGRVPVIVDAGANIGAASLWFKLAYPAATIVAIEPDPNNADLLRRNVEGMGVVVVEAAIGSVPGYVSISVEEGASWGAQTTRAESGLEIVTVDQAVGKVPRGELFIAKVDIEGFEADLFESNTDWIDRAFVVYVEPHDWLFPGRRTSRTFQRELAKRDFEIFIHRENLIYVR